jgi:hypothetical protein
MKRKLPKFKKTTNKKITVDIGQANFKRVLKTEWDKISKGVKKPDLPKQRVFITITDKFGYDFIFLGISDGLTGAFNDAAEAAIKSKYKYNPTDKIKINYVLLEEETTLGRFAHSEDVVDGLVFGDNYEVCIVSSQFTNFPLLLEDGRVNETCLFPLIKKNYPNFDVSAINSDTEITVFQLLGSSDVMKLADKAKKKLDLMYEAIVEKENLITDSDDESSNEKQVVFVSICDGRNSANVFHGKSKDFRDAYEIAAEKTLQFVESNLYDVLWLKVDFVKEQKTVAYSDFLTKISRLKYGNPGAFGLYEGVSLDTNFRYPLLSMELNGCRVWDFKEKKFLENNLKYVFATKGIKFDTKIDNIKNVIVFKTQGYIIEEDDNISYLMYNSENYGRRENNWNKNDYMAAIKSSMEFLFDTQKPDGSFYYGFMPSADNVLTSYNSLRHCGAVLALVQYCDLFGIRNKNIQTDIESALEWIVRAILKKDDNTFFVTDTISKEIKLGGGAIAILAFEAYDNFFETDKYLPQIKGLANGILFLQEENGSFYHVLNEDFSQKERNRIVYYDGEAVYALAKAYTVTKDEVYLKAAEKTIHYFIETNYEKYCDHWVAYAVNEVTKYVHNREYFEFGLWNASSNLKKVYNRKTAYHTYMEMMMAAYGTYKRVIELGMELPDTFDEEFFNLTILKRADYMLNSYFFPEMVMYMKKPMKYVGTFSVRHWDWRIRIDDLQHFIGGYYQFVKNGLA